MAEIHCLGGRECTVCARRRAREGEHLGSTLVKKDPGSDLCAWREVTRSASSGETMEVV